MIEWSMDSDKIVTLTLNMTEYPTNVLNKKTIDAISAAVDRAVENSDVRGVIMASSRKDFLAGADLKALMPLDDVDRNMRIVEKLKTAFRKMETSGKPFVAAINGAALGGGYEFCLACHYRVALDDSRIRIGLPEAQLGLLPGAGGTQRLPRLIGISPALQLMVEGKTLNPKAALESGLINALATDSKELLELARKWILENGKAIQPWDEKGAKIPGGGVQTPNGYMTFTAGTALLRKKTGGNYPAPLAIMSAVYEGLQVPFEQGLKIEARYFIRCLRSDVAKNTIRTMFFGVSEANKGAARPKGFPQAEFKKVGILGAGMMGSGIAYAAAKVGLNVALKDVTDEAAQKGKAYSRSLVEKLVEKGRMSEQKAKELLDRIHPTTEASDLKGCDLVIEAVTEDRKIKDKVIKEAESVLSSEAITASNTSTLPITGLAEYSSRPEKFIGIHFFSPVDKMQLVEIIIGKQTSQETLALAFDFVRKLDKTPIVVNDGRGFYTSRVFSSYINAGMACLKDGVNPALIENAGKASGMPVGPLAVADEVSLDLVYHVIKQTEEDLGRIDDSPAAVVSKLFVEDLGRLGRKVKKGFYDYSEDGEKHLWPELARHFPLSENQPSVEIGKRRLLHAQALEAVRAFEEGVLPNPVDGDIGSIFGWGFAPYTGGVFSYIDTIGIKRFVEECEDLERLYGKSFSVPKVLYEMAAKNKSFYT